MPVQDFLLTKLGGHNKIVRVGETMIIIFARPIEADHLQKTDKIGIIEFNGSITRAFANVITNKCKSTLFTIIYDKFSKLV